MMFDTNTVLQMLNIGLLVWLGKRQISRVDGIENKLNKTTERVSKIEGKIGVNWSNNNG